MRTRNISRIAALLFSLAAGCTHAMAADIPPETKSFGRVAVSTIPFDDDLQLSTATYTPSGKVLVAYRSNEREGPRHVNLAVMDDDGSNLRPFFSGTIPPREKDNGLRFMVFADNRRIFLGDFILECAPDIDTCDQSTLIPVKYPEQVAGGPNILHRWSEIIVAPDNEHVAWTTLLSNYSAMMLVGKLARQDAGYTIVEPRIISTVEAFASDPDHPGAVLPNPVRNGEVKQFIQGGTAISLVGALGRDTADSVVQHLASGEMEQITRTPGYDETTILSPDEKLGIVMTTRFSPATDMAILGLMPRPYPVSLNMGLSWPVYTYSVTGVRKARTGNVGPALIDIELSKTRRDYLGVNLNTQDEWVYHSPMSWHPDSTKAIWLEGRRGPHGGDDEKRVQIVELLEYRPGPAVAAQPFPAQIAHATSDLTIVDQLVRRGSDIDVRVHGRHAGYVEYRRTAAGVTEKTYVDFSDDGEHIYKGSETMRFDPQGNSTYTADLELLGPQAGTMALKITFGPLQGDTPARLVSGSDAAGAPLTHGYAEYDGVRLTVDSLAP